jgi:pimeloyl-ACP methyl ester carboxylesterase
MENRRKILVPLFSTVEFQSRMKRLVDSAESHDCRSEFHKIQHPTLVISSKYDCLTPMHEQELLVQEIPNAHHVILPNCGHASMYEDPLVFMALVLGFANAKDVNYVI